MNAPADPAFAERCRESFGRQKAMALIGAILAVVEPGYVKVALPFRDDLTQQKGYVHGGILGMIADTACGYSAFSLMPAGCSLVTVEYKMNILAPGLGSLVAKGEVVKPGRTLTVARAEVYADDGKHVATMLQTLMMLANTADTPCIRCASTTARRLRCCARARSPSRRRKSHRAPRTSTNRTSSRTTCGASSAASGFSASRSRRSTAGPPWAISP